MTDSQFLDKALNFIVEREEDNDYICEKLHEIPEEHNICAEDCENINRSCILRFLKHYKEEEVCG